LDGVIEVVGGDEALARGAVVGAELLAEHRVRDRVEVAPARLLDRRHRRRVGVDDRVGKMIGERATQPLAGLGHETRILTERPALVLVVGSVVDRHDPLRRALEQVQASHRVDQCAGDLRGR